MKSIISLLSLYVASARIIDAVGQFDSNKMIKVNVQFKGFLEHLSGCTELCLTAEPGIQLSEFLVLLAERLGGDFKKLLLDKSGTVDRGIMIAIEGKAIPNSHFTGHRLDNNCSLSIMPVVAGG